MGFRSDPEGASFRSALEYLTEHMNMPGIKQIATIAVIALLVVVVGKKLPLVKDYL